MIGRGRVYERIPGTSMLRVVPSGPALRKQGLHPVRLTAKEGLALINGTQMMTAYAALAAHRARALCTTADVISAISVEALRGSDTAYDERIHRLRPYPGQLAVASNLRQMMKRSKLRESHRHGDERVQDAYSVRCIPQVHGASRDAVSYVEDKVSIEINSANDNPLIFPDDGVHLEGGNFHGQPMALAMDFLAIALAELANISERRTERLVNGSLSGLPRFLTSQGGLNSGLMIAQYTAASIVSENKVLCHPASVDSIPTSANQEDHNSMGSISAQKAWKVLRNVETVLAIELLCACQGLDFARAMQGPRPLTAGAGTEAAYRQFRRTIPHLGRDRIIHADIQQALARVLDGTVVHAARKAAGRLA
jgi:histidine ammonia-lyase